MYILKTYYNGHASIVCSSKLKKDIVSRLRKDGYSYCKRDDTYNKKTGYYITSTCKIEHVEDITNINYKL